MNRPYPRHETGKRGEMLAAEHLKKCGYKILARNLRSPFGEIDIVATHQKTLVFVEVKTRSGHTYGTPEEAIDRRKKEHLIRVASWYLVQKKKLNSPARFDVLAIDFSNANPDFRLIQNAFTVDEVVRD